jgi:hypothetical protein
MKRAHCVISRACSWIAVYTRAWVVALITTWMAMVPHAAWGQSAWPGYPNNNTISVTGGGNVGIGTNPNSRLHLAGSSDSNSFVQVDGASNGVQSIFGSQGTLSYGFAGTFSNHGSGYAQTTLTA